MTRSLRSRTFEESVDLVFPASLGGVQDACDSVGREAHKRTRSPEGSSIIDAYWVSEGKAEK